SLLNKLIGTKISATSHKAQTTRNNIRGILTEGDTQIVFIDTPGIFTPKCSLETKIVTVAKSSLQDVELICLVIDIIKGIDKTAKNILEKHNREEQPIVVIINKTDKAKEPAILQMAQELATTYQIKDIFFSSCTKNKGIESIKKFLHSKAQEDHWYYDPNTKTDRESDFVASEITREKLFNIIRHEIPYGINVVTKSIKPEEDNIFTIHQDIIISHKRHKPIIIGNKGEQLKSIALMATKDLEGIFNCKVKLYLSIKVNPKWIDSWDNI
ncbi:GTPase Era, partial [Rickettsiales bacterium]|nr:GTPase Era [Rickettsiales bacterium]